QLGTLTEATRRMEQVGREIAGLEQILRAPKVRGGLGEIMLERLLEEILPAGTYHPPHVFRSGERGGAGSALAGRVAAVATTVPAGELPASARGAPGGPAADGAPGVRAGRPEPGGRDRQEVHPAGRADVRLRADVHPGRERLLRGDRAGRRRDGRGRPPGLRP